MSILFYDTFEPMKRFNIVYLCISLAFTACRFPYQYRAVEYDRIDIHNLRDSSIQFMIKPYKESLDSVINEVIGYTETDLIKEVPEGTLGNFVCDELLEYVKKYTYYPVEICILNSGGLRVPSIAIGEIRTGQIYELLPFENTLEIIEMNGTDCKRLFDRCALQGGVPVAGLRFVITPEGASQIFVNGETFDVQKKYYILTNNYLADGGEETMKYAIKRYPLGIKLRDTVIKSLKEKKKNNQTIKAVKDGRIIKIQ